MQQQDSTLKELCIRQQAIYKRSVVAYDQDTFLSYMCVMVLIFGINNEIIRKNNTPSWCNGQSICGKLTLRCMSNNEWNTQREYSYSTSILYEINKYDDVLFLRLTVSKHILAMNNQLLVSELINFQRVSSGYFYNASCQFTCDIIQLLIYHV